MTDVGRLTRRKALVTLGASTVTLVAPALPASVDPYTLKGLRRTTEVSTTLAQEASGRRLVVVVMKGTWCPVCVRQLRRLATMRSQLEEFGVRVVGLNTDSSKKNRALREREKLPFELLSDSERRVTKALGLWIASAGHPMPAIVVFDRCGAERGRLTGRRPGQRPESALLQMLAEMKKHPAKCREPVA